MKVRWALILTLWSVLLVIPRQVLVGPEIVMNTYLEAAERLKSGGTPYAPPEKGDVFLYSPFFAFVFQPFLNFPPKLAVVLWSVINAALFWIGVFYACNLKRDSIFFWVGLAAASMELDGSLRYQQTNALTIGLILLGVTAFSKGQALLSGATLALASNIKLFGLPFAFGLLWARNTRYTLTLFVSLLTLFLLPSLQLGFQKNLWLHWEQGMLLFNEVSLRRILDIASVFERLGRPELGRVLLLLITWITALLWLVGAWFSRENRQPFSQSWIAVVIAGLLLINPRTESPTFVMAGPLFLLLFEQTGVFNRTLLLPAFFVISILYNSLWPHFLRPSLTDGYTLKVFGLLWLWVVSGYLFIVFLLRFLHSSRARPAAGS